MKPIHLISLLIALPAACLAQFTPVADDFSGTGNLVGTTPDSGLGVWSQISNNTPALATASGALNLAAASGEAAQLNFASGNLTTGTIYLGWDFTVSASGTITTSDTIQAVAGFRSGTASSGVFELSFGVFRPSSAAQTFSGVPSTTTSQVAVGLFTGASLNAASSNLVEWPAALSRGAQYRAVIGLDLDADEARLWINPSSVASSFIALPSTAAVRGVFFRQGGASHGAMTIDNLVASQNFGAAASPAAIPEPASFGALLGVFSLAAGSARRRARAAKAPRHPARG